MLYPYPRKHIQEWMGFLYMITSRQNLKQGRPITKDSLQKTHLFHFFILFWRWQPKTHLHRSSFPSKLSCISPKKSVPKNDDTHFNNDILIVEAKEELDWDHVFIVIRHCFHDDWSKIFTIVTRRFFHDDWSKNFHEAEDANWIELEIQAFSCRESCCFYRRQRANQIILL